MLHLELGWTPLWRPHPNTSIMSLALHSNPLLSTAEGEFFFCLEVEDAYHPLALRREGIAAVGAIAGCVGSRRRDEGKEEGERQPW